MDYNASQTAIDLGLVSSDYNFLMGFIGLFIGVSFCFFVLNAISTIARGR